MKEVSVRYLPNKPMLITSFLLTILGTVIISYTDFVIERIEVVGIFLVAVGWILSLKSYKANVLLPPSGRSVTISIAAKDSQNPEDSDYQCDGVANEVEINKAIESLR